MQLSYWEYKTWFSDIDFTIVGSGITGLNCALQLRKNYPRAKIVLLEKGMLPQGASTKNAGFACFGSASELLSDLRTHTEEEVVHLVRQRWEGIQLLRKNLGDSIIDFQQHGGYELFLEKSSLYDDCISKLEYLNELLLPVFGKNVFEKRESSFGFRSIHKNTIFHTLEGQLDTGKMMSALLLKASRDNILLLNSITVTAYEEANTKVLIETDGFNFSTKKLFLATNGFSKRLINEKVRPARAQVLITKPIENLSIKGTFHLDEGYYYFRNIDNRILFGGGRNLNFDEENTFKFGLTDEIQESLEHILKKVILPNTAHEIDRRWSGIMGMGHQKKPIVKQVSENVFCGVRLGGMGIAIGSIIGKELAELVNK
ncbi:NAD(P)/FAD-dependent oxidoreductase [Costertonia aggregata]|uniref:FAD-binding oxidoreductase n=1 Tax=Costertonia aggregata TaxID=343403 RepID=A0A7H9APT7_9FLAO|nr:FAD-dependent oxidoreductase [Costertonia aggregata]QLG45434.1 FAD-binding oxidoreductase [Costertonia aggregata]